MNIRAPAAITAALASKFGVDHAPGSNPSAAFLACMIRHTASRLCPCPPQTLMAALVTATQPLFPSYQGLREALENTVEAVIGYGDLLECQLLENEASTAAGRGPLLYLAPPAFVRRQSGSLLLLGVMSDDVQTLPELQSLLCHRGHVRYVAAEQAIEAVALLRALGYLERTEAQWLIRPVESTPQELVRVWDNRLNAMGPSGDEPDLQVLDTRKPATFYLGRWSHPTDLTGRYVARRRRRYGADLWCYAELTNGKLQRFVDLPSGTGPWRGCDEAWHLQSALDAAIGTPQEATIADTGEGNVLLRLFAPVPSWAQRRWDALGTPMKAPRCLIAYVFDASEIAEETAFLRQCLWMHIAASH